MRVSIEHSEIKKGMISKKTYHCVSLTVQFSEEEKAIINQNKLTKAVVLERDIPADRNPNSFKGIEDVHNLTIYRLINGKKDEHVVATPLEAKQYEQELTEALQNLKAFLEENAGIEEKSKSFEL